MRELIFAAMLALASVAIIVGAAMVAAPAGWITAGGLLAAWSWLIFGEIGAQ